MIRCLFNPTLSLPLIHRLRQRSRTAGKVCAAVVRCRDAVLARGRVEVVNFATPPLRFDCLQGRRAIVEDHGP